MKRVLIICTFFLATLCGACVSALGPVRPLRGLQPGAFLNPVAGELRVERDIVYSRPALTGGGAAELALDLYRPAGDEAERRPVIVWLHGGGFSSGNKAEMAGLSSSLARRGYACVSIDYRLASDPGRVDDATLDAATEDVYAAVRGPAQSDGALRTPPGGGGRGGGAGRA